MLISNVVAGHTLHKGDGCGLREIPSRAITEGAERGAARLCTFCDHDVY